MGAYPDTNTLLYLLIQIAVTPSPCYVTQRKEIPSTAHAQAQASTPHSNSVATSFSSARRELGESWK